MSAQGVAETESDAAVDTVTDTASEIVRMTGAGTKAQSSTERETETVPVSLS